MIIIQFYNLIFSYHLILQSPFFILITKKIGLSYHIVQKELDRISTVFRKYIWDNLNLKCRLLVYTKFNWKGHFKEIGNHPPNEKKLTSNEGLVGLPIRRHNMDRNDKAFL